MQKRQKILNPVLREKKRYLVYKVDYFGNKTVETRSVNQSIKRRILGFLGELGLAEAGIMFIKSTNKKGILRVNRKFVDHTKTSLMTVNKTNNQGIAIRCLGLSGSINKAEKIYQGLK